MELILYMSGVRGNEKNCVYHTRVECRSPADLKDVITKDHVCAKYKGDRRGKDNFISSTCIVMDCDNDHTDEPDGWITPQALEEEWEKVAFAVSYSRNHMKEKGGKAARPRFHVYFQVPPVDDAESYAGLKHRVQEEYPFFDANALDAGRFIYGTDNKDVVWHDGQMTIDSLLTGGVQASIPQGKRNATLSRYAGRMVKRYGVSQEAYDLFLEEAEKCDPPLSEKELAAIWNSARRFAKTVQGQPGYVPPERYGKGGMKPPDYTDIGQAKMVASDCASELAYTTATDFLVYNGKVWVESKPKSVGCMERFLDRQLADASAMLARAKEIVEKTGVKPSESKEFMEAMAYFNFVMKRRDMKYITSALQAVKPMVEVEPSDLDRDEDLLNCPDGTYDLKLGMAGRKDHDYGDFITKMTAYGPSDEGKDLWLSAIDTIFQGDVELIEYVHRIVGLSAIGEIYQEAIIIAYGNGANGKSTFWNAIAGVMGTYAGMISADALTAGCRRNVKPEIAEVKGKRILIAAELEEDMRMSTSIVKQLSSTDEINGEKKYKDPFKFKPTHTLVLYTNHLPKVGAMDYGIWRRLIVIPFGAKITGKKDIKNYGKYLLKHAGPYIMQWIIEGAKKVIDDDYRIPVPKCVQDAIDDYRAENDWMSHFLEACCEVGSGYEEKSGELYSSYRSFCARSGEFIRSTGEFYKSLQQRGFERHKRKKGVYVQGLQLGDAEVDF